MRERTGRADQTNRNTFSIILGVAVVLIVAVVMFRHRIIGPAPQAVELAPNSSAQIPALAQIQRNSGSATVTLDAVFIDGKATVVAGLKNRRTFRISRKDTIGLSGWAFDPEAGQPAGALIVRYGATNLPASYGLSRQDVAAAYKLPSLTLVGFSALASGRNLHDGANPISFAVISHDLKSYYVNPSEIVLDLH